MKRYILIISVLAGSTMGAVAQTQTPSRTFTLQECIDYALENSIQTQNAKIDEQIAKARVSETVGIGLPQITGGGSVTHNQKLQRFFQTKQVAGAFVGGEPDPADPFLPGVGDNDVVAAQNFFQLPSSGDVNVSVNQLIFNGSYFVGLKASKAYKEMAYKSAVQTKEQIVHQVTKAYYTVLINKERTTLFESNIARVDSLLRNTRAMNENGFAEEIDVDRIRVTLNNLRTERDKFTNLSLLGVELLKFQMNYPMSENIDVSGSIADIEIDTILLRSQAALDYKSRPDYQVLEANKKLQELNIRNLYATALPSLSAFYNAGYMTQARNLGGLFKTETDFSQVPDHQLATGIGVDKWYDYSMFGLRLNVPIFTGLQNTYKIQQQKLELTKINNNVKMLESSIELEVRQSSYTFDNALKTLESQEENMELASKVARVTKIKYGQGVGSNIEVVDAEDALRQSQTNYYNALFEAVIAKVDLDKAYGKLLPPSETK